MQNRSFFNGLKVVELANVLAGPLVGQFFAELGAEVIKIENPATGGDVTRSWLTSGEKAEDGRSAYFAAANWGKTSKALDLKNDSQFSELKALISKADIVISNYKPGDAEKLGLTYDQLKIWNDQLIVVQITGYGSNDPRAGYDAIIQAEAGFMFINGEKHAEPLKMPLALMDILTAHQAKEAVLIALINRLKYGIGDCIHINLMDVALSSLANQGSNYLNTGIEPQALGSEHPNIAPYGKVYYCKNEDPIVLAIGTDRQFQNCCAILGIPDTAWNDAFKNNAQRVQNRIALDDLLKPQIVKYSRAELLEKFAQASVPAGAVNKISEAMQMAENKGLIVNAEGKSGLRTFSAKFENNRIPRKDLGLPSFT